MNPQDYYSEELLRLTDKSQEIKSAIDRMSNIRLLVGLCAVVCAAAAILFGVSVVIFIFAVVRQAALVRKQELTGYSIDIFRNELNVMQGDFSQHATGEEHMDIAHAYILDMDVFGNGSVYQLLVRTVSLQGGRLLASLLKQPYATAQEIRQRQADVQELSGNPGLLHAFQLLGKCYKEGKDDRQNILGWLQQPGLLLQNKALNIFYILSPVAIVLILSGCMMGWWPQLVLLPAIIVNWTVLGLLAKRIRRITMLVASGVSFIDKYEALFKLVQQQSFTSPRLSAIAAKAQQSVAAIAWLRKLAKMLENNQHGMVKPFMNTLFLFDVYCCIQLEKWKQTNSSLIAEAMDAAEQLDVLVSLATYAFNNPDNIYAEVADEHGVVELLDVKHPLISRQVVGNDFRIGNPERYYLLTGANMTGKSTYIRTVGISVLLSYTGIPIKASKAVLPVLRLYTSMRITDSLQDDRSYFRAELGRMQHIMQQTADAQPALILIDEPLKGTNSLDKRNGTIAIIRRLLERNTVGIIATHDTQLCDMEVLHAPLLVNKHFDSEVKDGELVFDYMLKNGCSQSNNATILMEKMGII
jgi:hypothetical protein